MSCFGVSHGYPGRLLASEAIMLRQFMLGKIHRCTVTRADLDYVGSVTIDPVLMKAAGFSENERVEI